VDENGWRLDRNQTIRFVKRERPGVTGIECKVRSLSAALEYLNQVKCPARAVAGKVELDRAATFGLAITLSDE
jgi:hypothetical protein